MSTERGLAPPLVAVALVAAASLGYQVLLLRLFSIIQWHHFAYMIISLALLGHGISGTLLSVLREALLRRFRLAFWGFGLAFVVAAPLCFRLAAAIEFNALALTWDGGQWLRLILIYLVLAVPFLCSASCIGLALLRYHTRIGLVYGADLLGAGSGALAMVGLLFWLPPPNVTPSPYKDLSRSLQTLGAERVAERSGPLGLVTVLDNRRVPLRIAPGLSLSSPAGLPHQLGIYVDGDQATPITRFDGDMAPLGFLTQMPPALAYELGARREVAILGAGGGLDVLQALRYGAARIDAVEANPQTIDLIADTFAAFSGGLYRDPRVTPHADDARGFLSRTGNDYDLIQMGPIGGFTHGGAGVHALNETFLYTVEALRLYYARLQADGILSLSRWVRVPPREGIKLFATAVSALRRAGIAEPGSHLLWIRSWNLSTLLVKRGAFSDAEIAEARAFSAARGFDLAWYPGMPRAQANRFHRQQGAPFYSAASALLGTQAGQFIADYKFNVAPATDDRPYFFHFFRWRTAGELLALRAAGGAALADLGYLILLATLVQALALSLLLILIPLLAAPRLRRSGRGLSGRTALYFIAIGLGFMAVEIGFIQQFVRFLAEPIYAYAAMICGFLVFAGLGSMRAGAASATAGRRPLTAAIAAIALFGVFYMLTLDGIFAALDAAGLPLRMAVSLLLVAPLAFAMGMPFPLALTTLAEGAPALAPWAWAINGCASVVGAVLAMLLALHFGLRALLIVAIGLYALAWCTFPAAGAVTERSPPRR